MSRTWRWAINLTILLILLVCVGVIYKLTAKQPGFMLSCSSELFNRQQTQQDSKHYLLVDLFSKDGQAQINYRYFDLEGNSAGSVSMQGQVNKVDLDSMLYDISVKTKQEYPHSDLKQAPEHYKYLSYVSNLNLNRDGMHNLSVQVLERDENKDFAVVLFQPSNTVCGCRLVN
ncbi:MULTISPECIES: hypothetical protein [unclassified Shewanella]|uniref:hypothetical protein n=1 Tax=unclassified Shewanella TaxID=196818 RepID=UPI001BC0F6B1|nr:MULTISPECIES: hypothetical protein [unclassified Shewanella]MCG9728706.1 hypothetical protein [Shewanella sp. Isolate13]GIU28302.1 hypothetical protein TUM3792_36900 [Shewanella sp. MBTL60-007]